MLPTIPARPAFCALLCLALAACGGGNSGAVVGGSLSGLGTGASVTLEDNTADALTLNANGAFRFGQTLAAGATYTVTVLTQPSGQNCTVENGGGQIDTSADSVATVDVTCMSVASIGGTVSGLAPGTSVTLSNGSVLLPTAINGAFAFPGLLPVGAAYSVTVATQPVGEICSVLNGTGTLAAGVPVVVTVTCS